jgi:hypothetical protein
MTEYLKDKYKNTINFEEAKKFETREEAENYLNNIIFLDKESYCIHETCDR